MNNTTSSIAEIWTLNFKDLSLMYKREATAARGNIPFSKIALNTKASVIVVLACGRIYCEYKYLL